MWFKIAQWKAVETEEEIKEGRVELCKRWASRCVEWESETREGIRKAGEQHRGRERNFLKEGELVVSAAEKLLRVRTEECIISDLWEQMHFLKMYKYLQRLEWE